MQVFLEKKRRTRETNEQETDDRDDDNIVCQGNKLFMKLSPSLFCDMIKNLSVSQREWISQTGFGSILNFDLQSYPKYLSYSVVNNFDYDSCCIVIDGRSIEVSDVDVHDVLGLPLGPQKIPFVKVNL